MCLPESAAQPTHELAFSLAHELNQPLTALAIAARACSQLVRTKELSPQALIQAIDHLALQAERAGELVRRMRQLASGATPCRSLVAVGDLVHGAIRMLEADLLSEQVTLSLHIPDSIPSITVDQIQIEQVLINLLRNAIEAMSETPAGERFITVAASLENAELVTIVSDTGRGLSANIAERLFEPYQTTKTHGMGLGLAVSRAILQAHGGRLWVEPGGAPGTTFHLALPLTTEIAEKRAPGR